MSASDGPGPEPLKVAIEVMNSRSLGKGSAGVDALQRFALEQDDHPAQLRLGALAADREDVVPAVGMERVGEQRRAEHVAHLGAGQARAWIAATCSLVMTLPCTISIL